MQRVLGYMRKAIQEFDLIQDGDRIGVGVSGGKDSVALLMGLKMLQRFIGIDYKIVGITLDPVFEGIETDYSDIEKLCKENNIEYVIKRTQIGQIVFEHRNEKSPCSLCARMRRGALHDCCNELGLNKLALGHHYNDAVETFVMNLFNEGRIGCFSPKSYLSRKQITLIRPLVFAPEKEISSAVRKANFPIVKSKCPVDGFTNREETKNFLREREKIDEGFTYRLYGAMRRAGIDGWGLQGETIRDKNYKKSSVDDEA
ncbi:MAG: tRNA 2-thiocytidine biosynthesis TtcA family protein [Oscillospiraceae bacterium]